MTEARSLVPPFRAPAREEQRGRAAGLLDAAGGGRGGLRGGRAGRTVVKVPHAPRRVPPPCYGVLHELALGARLRQLKHIVLGGLRGLLHGGQPAENLAPARSDLGTASSNASKIKLQSACRLRAEPPGAVVWRGQPAEVAAPYLVLADRALASSLAGSSRPGTEDASHSSRMRFVCFWALFGAWSRE